MVGGSGSGSTTMEAAAAPPAAANSEAAAAAAMEVFGAVSFVNKTINSTAVVSATYGSNHSIAATVRAHGKGRAIYCGFLPSFSYFRPSIL